MKEIKTDHMGERPALGEPHNNPKRMTSDELIAASHAIGDLAEQLDDDTLSGPLYRRLLNEQITDDDCMWLIGEVISWRQRRERNERSAQLAAQGAKVTDAELMERAIKAYYRRCNRDGVTPQQPSAALSEVTGPVWSREVVLRNVNGDLARYDVSSAGKLRWTGPYVYRPRAVEAAS